MTTLGDLRAELFPAARAVGPVDGDGRLAWVRVMKARVPAFDALEPGDLAIVPASALAVLAATPEELGPIVAAFRSTGVSGVLLVEGDSLAPASGDRLSELEVALADAGVPSLRLAPADPSAVERSVIGYIVSAAGELDRQAGLLEADLERRAIAGEGAAAMVATAAEFLARPLALEGPRGDLVTVHAPAGEPDATPGVAAYVAGRREPAVRVAIPSGGALVAVGERPLTELERRVLDRAATLLALELARDEAVRRASDRGRREALPSGGPPWVVVLARQRGAAAEDDGPAARSAREGLRRELRLLAPARRLALRGDADSLEFRVVIAPEAGADATGLAARVAEVLGRTVAVSRPFTSPADRPTAEAEARATLEAGLALRDAPVVARAERLAAYRLLGAVHNVPDGPRLAGAILAPILSGRADVRRERLDTLRAVLDGGGINEAAAALGVHRNTVAYRLRRIEAATGWQLTDPELRLPLAIAVRLVQEPQG